MPRSCAAASLEKLFDADASIGDCWNKIAKILFVVGLNPADFETYEIDDIIASMRETFSITNSEIGRNQAHPFLTQNYSVLVNDLRNTYLNLQLSKYGKES